MSLLRDWLARRAQAWLDGFLGRHDLAGPVNNSSDRADLDPSDISPREHVVLHVGCGNATLADMHPPGFRSATAAWSEIRLDANADIEPDIVANMLDMAPVADASMDAVYSAHNVEHLYPHEVPVALCEFWRVLRPDGFAVVGCPDLQAVCALVAEGKLTEAAYVTESAGPIAPLDILYGYRRALAKGNYYMAHRGGFTIQTLMVAMFEAGFASVRGVRRPDAFDLWVLATKSRRSDEDMATLARDYLPGFV